MAEADQAGAVGEHGCEIAEKMLIVHFAQHDGLHAVLLLKRIGEPVGADMLERGHDKLVTLLPVETAYDLLHGAGGVGLDAELLFLDVEHSGQSAAGGFGLQCLAYCLENGVAGRAVGSGLKVGYFPGHGKVLPKLFNRHA